MSCFMEISSKKGRGQFYRSFFYTVYDHNKYWFEAKRRGEFYKFCLELPEERQDANVMV